MTLRKFVLMVPLMLVSLGSAWALPGPGYDETIGDPTAYSLVVNLIDPVNFVYQWDVTFNGATGADPDGDPTTPQFMKAFFVYDVPGGGVNLESDLPPSTTDPTGWAGSADGAPLLVEWIASPATNRLDPGESITFIADLDGALVNPYRTAIQIQSGDYSLFVNNTPELPPSLLSMLGFGGLAFFRRFRRRK